MAELTRTAECIGCEKQLTDSQVKAREICCSEACYAAVRAAIGTGAAMVIDGELPKPSVWQRIGEWLISPVNMGGGKHD